MQLDSVCLYTPSGSPILENITARIAPKKWTRLAGASGTGKSTLLRTIGGLWADYSGQWQPPRGTSLLLPQRAYVGKGTLAQILSYPAEESRYGEDDCRQALTQVGLEKYAAQLHHSGNWAQNLSAGEQQRIAIARALLLRPDYLYLDEATSALDEPSARALLEWVKTTQPETTVVFISHQSSLNGLCDEVLDLECFKPKNPVQAA